MNIVIFDFEVFNHDILLGARVLDENGSHLFQSWNLDQIRDFYYEHRDDIWVGHNNQGYDDFILEAIVRDNKDEEEVSALSRYIIDEHPRMYRKLHLYSFDLMQQHFYSLKLIEAYMGKNISETKVDFRLERRLTESEKRLTESYNRDDLEQTEEDFNFMKGVFTLRLDVIAEFNLPMWCLEVSGTRLAEEVLGAKKTPGIENWVVKPTIYPQLRIKNQDVIDFYLREGFRHNENVEVTLCGAVHKLGSGGIHAALSQYHTKHALYFDVSGYYNLVMLNYDLLPRSIPQAGKEKYKNMYFTQLEMKKTGNPKRGAYKTILLSVFGAMMNEHCRFYDPYNGLLVTMTGQLFLVDLLEKLEGKVRVVQSNTDGIIVEPYNWDNKQEVLDIVSAWCERTGFVIKPKEVFDIHQRDVNCYMYRDSEGEIQTLGEAVKDYGKWQWPFWKESYNSKEPLIVSTGLVEYYMLNKMPEQVVEEHKHELRMFQYLCKKKTFDWLEYEETDLLTGETKLTYLQGVNRAFAMNSDKVCGMVYKRKYEGKVTKAKISNLPDSVFVYDEDIRKEETVKELSPKINYDYYINRIYERIEEFRAVNRIKRIARYE